MPNVTFSSFTQETSPVLSDHVVGYRNTAAGGERRYLMSDVLGLFTDEVFGTASGILQADGLGNITGTGITYSSPSLILENGTAATPALTFTGTSHTTGLYWAGPGVMGFSSQGVASLSMNAGGILAGTSSNSLTLNGTGGVALAAGGTNQNITLTPSGTGNLNIPFPSSGGLGVGTTSDGTGARINVLSRSATTTPTFANYSSTTGDGYAAYSESSGGFNATVAGTNQRPVFNMRKARGTLAAPTVLIDGEVMGSWLVSGYDGAAFQGGAGLEVYADGTISTGIVPAMLTFQAATSAGSRTIGAQLRSSLTFEVGNSASSAANWTTSGVTFNSKGRTVTNTTSSGTVATTVANSFGTPTFAASSATTFTNAANLYIAGDVANGTNVTLTNSYGLWNVGKTRLDGAVVLPSTNTSGLQLYNTADQTTNYERLESFWSGNEAYLRTAQAGTGVARAIRIGTLQQTLIIAASSSVSGAFRSIPIMGATAGAIGWSIAPAASSATSGSQAALSLTPTYNQSSGTASNTDLLINRTQTAVGSGAQLLIDAQVGSASQFSVSNGGAIATSVQALSGAGAVNVTQTSTDFTSTGGAQALTLANGIAGQIKTICHVTDGGSGVLTPTTKTGYTTITFTNAGDSVTLRYSATGGWYIVGIFGAVAA